jgi:hypothetical protein
MSGWVAAVLAAVILALLALATMYLPLWGRSSRQHPDPDGWLCELFGVKVPPATDEGPGGWRRRGGDPARPDPRLPSRFEGLAGLRGGWRPARKRRRR